MVDSADDTAGGGQSAGPTRGVGGGPSPGDIFSLPETLAQIKATALVYVVVAIGYAVIAAGIGTFGGGGAGGLAVGATVLISLVLVVISPVLAVLHGYRHTALLSELPDNVLYATTATANAVGVLALFVVAAIFAFAAASPSSDVGRAIGDSVVPVIVVMIGVAIISAGTAWATRSMTPGSGSALDASTSGSRAAQD